MRGRCGLRADWGRWPSVALSLRSRLSNAGGSDSSGSRGTSPRAAGPARGGMPRLDARAPCRAASEGTSPSSRPSERDASLSTPGTANGCSPPPWPALEAMVAVRVLEATVRRACRWLLARPRLCPSAQPPRRALLSRWTTVPQPSEQSLHSQKQQQTAALAGMMHGRSPHTQFAGQCSRCVLNGRVPRRAGGLGGRAWLGPNATQALNTRRLIWREAQSHGCSTIACAAAAHTSCPQSEAGQLLKPRPLEKP